MIKKEKVLCAQDRSSINEAVKELETTYGSTDPYVTVQILEGFCYIWNETFLDKCIFSMSTNITEHLFDKELEIWTQYILWSDSASSSADDTILNAIGCTILNEQQKSFVVLNDGTITAIECSQGLNNFKNKELYKSLDTVFVAKVNCMEYNTCADTSTALYSATDCTT